MECKEKTLALLLVLALLSCIVNLQAVNVRATQPTTTIIVPDNYSNIRAAIDNASSGDTVFVRSGTCNQTINIDKSLKLVGQDAQTTILTMPIIYGIVLGAPVGHPTTYCGNY